MNSFFPCHVSLGYLATDLAFGHPAFTGLEIKSQLLSSSARCYYLIDMIQSVLVYLHVSATSETQFKRMTSFSDKKKVFNIGWRVVRLHFRHLLDRLILNAIIISIMRRLTGQALKSGRPTILSYVTLEVSLLLSKPQLLHM